MTFVTSGEGSMARVFGFVVKWFDHPISFWYDQHEPKRQLQAVWHSISCDMCPHIHAHRVLEHDQWSSILVQ